MKARVKFILTHFDGLIPLLILSNALLSLMSVEIFSYIVSLYIFTTIIGVLLFLLFGFLADKLQLKPAGRITGYALLCLCLLNSIPYFIQGRFLTAELLGSMIGKHKPDSLTIGIHLIAIVSFVIGSRILFRKEKQ